MSAGTPIVRSCDVDGCRERLTITPDWTGFTHYTVTHGANGEATIVMSSYALLVSTGYESWARSVHEYESGWSESA